MYIVVTVSRSQHISIFFLWQNSLGIGHQHLKGGGMPPPSPLCIHEYICITVPDTEPQHVHGLTKLMKVGHISTCSLRKGYNWHLGLIFLVNSVLEAKLEDHQCV